MIDTRHGPVAPDDPALDELADLLPTGALLRDAASRLVYGRDASQERGSPAAVTLPESTAEVQAIVRWAARHDRPLVARGAGTGLAGGAVGADAVTVSLARMRDLRVDPVTRTVVAGPGVTRDAVDAAAAAHALAYPPDPSSGVASTIGGNVACNAGGPHCLSRGVTQRWVAGLGVVLADGRFVRVGGRAADTPGPDWTALFVGSEGTLGLITEITLRLAPRRPANRALMAAFPDVSSAGAAVTAVLAAGLRPAAVELMDRRIMRIIEDWIAPGLPVEAGAGLLVEVDGRAATLDARLAAIAEVLRASGASELRQARDDAQTAALWRGRKSAGGAMSRLAPAYYSVDVTVPRGALAAALAEVESILAGADLPAGYVAHVGDGNLHPLLPLDPADPQDRARVESVARAIAEMAVRRGGSITGEHGVGREKRELLALQLDAATRGAMLQLRRALDPRGLFNPGAVFAVDEDVSLSEGPGHPRPPSPSPHAEPDQPTPSIQVAAADFVLHAPADTLVADAIAAAERAGRRLPLVAPWPKVTLAEVLEANLAPPNRTADGAPRDLLLAATITLPNGRRIRCGRAVHKNVAGYDLHRLLVGAGGRFGRFEALSLAISPPDNAQRSLIVPAADLRSAVAIAEHLAARALDARSVVVTFLSDADLERIESIGSRGTWCALLTAAGEPAEVDAEIEASRALLEARELDFLALGGVMESEEPALTGTTLWASAMHVARSRSAEGADRALRASLPAGRWTAALAAPQRRLLEAGGLFLDAVDGRLFVSDGHAGTRAALDEIAAEFGGHVLDLCGEAAGDGCHHHADTPDQAELSDALLRVWS